MARDLVGYRERSPVIHRPTGARIAINLVVNLESLGRLAACC